MVDYDKGQCVIVDQKPNTEIIIFQWSRNNGDCYNCGLPAQFHLENFWGPKESKRCAICAANDAVDGEKIYRIGSC